MSRRQLLYIGFLSSLILIIVSCSSGVNNEVEIKGKIKNISENHFLLTRESRDSLIVDTVFVDTQGDFSYKIPVDTLTLATVYFNDKTKYSYFVLDKGLKIEIKGDAKQPGLIDVQGGEINNELTDFRKKNKDLVKKRMGLLEMIADTTSVIDSVYANKKNDYVSELTNINFDMANVAADYVKANPEKISSVFIINSYFKDETFIPRLDECLELLKGEAATFPLAGELKSYSDKIKKSQEGASAPYFLREDVKGKSLSLSSLLGQYVLLSFISETSPTYEEVNKVMKDIYADFKKKKDNIEFVTILLDGDSKVMTQDEKNRVDWRLIVEKGGWSSELLDLYNIKELPYNILISPQGKIVKRNIPAYVIDDTFREFAEKNINKK